MVRGGLAGMLLVSCYSAQPPAGAPCDPATPSCPSGQTCEPTPSGDHVCSTNSGDDPLPDTPFEPPITDGDADGLPDFLDNCPSVANTTQEDEDGDGFGDACDRCPPIASADDPDRDSDGVGDACDPSPEVPGDSFVLFEGFSHGIPASWIATGQWLGVAGSATVTATNNNLATLVIPIVGSTNQTLRARVRILGLAQDTGGSLGIVARFSQQGSEGLHCGGGRNGSTGLFGLINAANGVFIKTVARPFTIGTTYDLTLASTGTSHTCTDSTPQAATVSDTFNSPGANTNVGLRSRVASASFDWVMLVKSP